MPFKECSLLDQREEFCRLALARGTNVRELCRRWGVSTTAGYKWLSRYRLAGASALVDRSRRPLVSPARTSPGMEARVLLVRADHPAWGGRKIRKVLQNDGLPHVPAASTITEILRRHDRLEGPRAGQARAWTRFEHAAPNDLWQMDFKGHVAMGQGRCHPLTVLDDHSRYALEVGACANERGTTVRARLERVFHRHGLPWRILADNGPPWGTAGSWQKHTPLTVWLLDLDVPVSHGRAYHPQTPGQGRAVPSHAQGRGAGRPGPARPRPGAEGLRRVAGGLQHAPAPSGDRHGHPRQPLRGQRTALAPGDRAAQL